MVAFMRRNGYIVDGKSSMETVHALYQADEKNDNCKIVVIPEFEYDRQFYRKLFADAGAWIYTQGDEVVCVGNGFIAVHTLGEQDSAICMPKGKVILSDNCCTTAVYDLQTCERVF